MLPYRAVIVFALLIGMGLAGCNFSNPPNATPTTDPLPITQIAENPSPDVPSDTPFPTITAVDVEVLITDAPSLTPTSEPPTLTPTITPTLGPHEHLVQEGETLGYIVQLYGYRDTSIYDEIVRINDNVDSPDFLPVGEIILIPRLTATAEPSSQVDTSAQVNTPSAGNNENTGPAGSICHTVRTGDTVIAIAEQYRVPLSILAQYNPNPALWNGCNFVLPGGGPNCNPFVVEGQCFYVPAPTPTPTLSPTPSGSETPTATPTYPAPVMGYPPEGALAQGAVRLYWVSAGILMPDEVYLIEVTDTTTQRYEAFVTRSTTLLLPESWIPSDGQTHTISWTVSVARPDPISGVYLRISGVSIPRTFQWQSG